MQIEDPNIHVVTETTYHYLPLCPCAECEQEREHRGMSNTPRDPVKSLSPDAAVAMGYISNRTPEGSVARKLMIQEGIE